MTDSKKPGVAFWATIVMFVVLAAYPLSMGPRCWWVAHKSRIGHLVADSHGSMTVVEAHLETESQGFVSFERRPGLMVVAFPLIVDPIYSPIAWIVEHSPKPVPDLLRWYLRLWVCDRSVFHILGSGDIWL
jgi:hypothetical protein